MALGINVVVVLGLENYANAVPVQDSSGFHGVVVLVWMVEDGGGEGSACRKGSSQGILLNEKNGFHPMIVHACGRMGNNHVVFCYQWKKSYEVVAPCGSFQRVFGFLDHVLD